MDEMGWYDGNSGKELHPVGKKKANAWGLHDMHGNVAEWCADSAIQYSHECVTNPPVREKGDNRVIRGGAVPVGAEVCRSFSWLQFDIAKSSGAIGFRPVCLDLEAQGQMTKKTERLRMELEGLGQGKQAGETKTIHLFDGASMEMAWCPPGTFLMGKNDGEENTQRKVTLTSGFWLAKTEVTQAQWKDVMGFNPAEFKTDSLPIDIDNSAARIGDNLPVGVSWNWSQQFCLKTGLKLPTEAQWEYACRAGGILQEPFTYEQQKAMAWTGMSGPPNPVATKQPNAWGLFDMVGNVAEWCTDWFERSLGSAAATDPSGPDTGTAKVLKGGTCMTLCECSPSARVGVNPLSVEKHTGFRPCYP